MEEETGAGEILQPTTLRFIKNSQSSSELNLCGFNVISTSAPPAALLVPKEKKNLPVEQKLRFEKMFSASLYSAWKEFSIVQKHLPSAFIKSDSRREQTFVSSRLVLPSAVNYEFIRWLKERMAKIENIQSFVWDWLVQNEKVVEDPFSGVSNFV